MGCCSGHNTYETQQHQDEHSEKSFYDQMENVIDLREDEYTVLPAKNDKLSWKKQAWFKLTGKSDKPKWLYRSAPAKGRN